MVVEGYATKSKFGFQKMQDEKVANEHTRYLSKNNVNYDLYFLVRVGNNEPAYILINDYLELRKRCA